MTAEPIISTVERGDASASLNHSLRILACL
jgi:hypothetical protein